MMLIRGEAADIMNTYFNQFLLGGFGKDAGIDIRGEDFRQDGKNIKFHPLILA